MKLKVRPLNEYKRIQKELGDTKPKFSFNLDDMKLDQEPQIGNIFKGTTEYVEDRLNSYNRFLKSDLFKLIMSIECSMYQGDNW